MDSVGLAAWVGGAPRGKRSLRKKDACLASLPAESIPVSLQALSVALAGL